MLTSKTLTVTILKPYNDVYRFVAEPENFPMWAKGLGSIELVDNEWRAETPDGPAIITFSVRNAFGVADHYVKMQDGAEIYVPMRVIANGDYADIVFTLFHQPNMSFEKFNADMALVEDDLATLKNLLEKDA